MTSDDKGTLAVLQEEERLFYPSKELVEQLNIVKWMKENNIENYDDLLVKANDIEWFWSKVSNEVVEWYQPPKKTLVWNSPYAKWFTDAKYNIVHDALDKHVASWRKNKVAIIFEGEPGDTRKLTYYDLYREVNRLSNALKKLGIKKGDRVALYLPMIPELPIAMLACAKLGAIHSVIFSGFSSGGLQTRINDCEAKLLITCDGFWRRGKKIPLKEQADKAVKSAPSVQHVIVYKRTGQEIPWVDGRDLYWHQLLEDQPQECPTEVLDSEDVLYILYTSGTTGTPKGVMITHGGYAVNTAITLKWVFDIKDADVYWCTADIGWVTGHSYIVYAPLILGSTSIMYEGAPNYPDLGRWWSIVEKYGVTIFYTAPTAIRMFMRSDEKNILKHDLSSLRLLGSVGETINPEAWIWYHEKIGKGKCPIMDTWWQTETGAFVISPVPLSPLKPGTPTKPLPGYQAGIFDEIGNQVKEGGGDLYLLTPWPSMLRGLFKNPERYVNTYWSKMPNQYLTGDKARIDADGYIWVQGRADDILKIAGHRIGNYEVESALVSHPNVAEAVVIGVPDPIKGESIVCFVVLKDGVAQSEDLKIELRGHVSQKIGKIARPSSIHFVNDVPKTRSGKIMRRVVKAKALGQELGDISTLRNPEAIDEIVQI